MKIKTLLAVAVLGLFWGSMGAIAAEEIRGHVIEVSPDKEALSVQTLPLTGEMPQKIDLTVTNESTLEGVASLKDLTLGDEVRVQAEKKLTGPWKIVSLFKETGMGMDAVPTAPSTASSVAGKASTARKTVSDQPAVAAQGSGKSTY